MAKRGRPRRVLSEDERREIIRCARSGMGRGAVVAATGICKHFVGPEIRRMVGSVRVAVWEPPGDRLSLDERIEIRLGLDRGESFNAIGRRLGRAGSTISREVGGEAGRGDYQPAAAHRAAQERTARPKPAKLVVNDELRDRVIADLKALWSPEQITLRLHHDYPDDPGMWVSHETIYQSIYVQGRGALRKELAACLRTGRAQRRPKDRMERRGHLCDMVMISERPAEVEDRAVPGHWEGDLIIGKGQKSAVGTLVERTTRFVMLLHLPHDRTADSVRRAMTATIQTLPAALFRTLTWDQGAEMAEHVQFRVDTGVDVYFCDPRSPWQRGSNENTNGLLRQYLPKGTDLSVHSPEALQRIADSLNGRPRKTLGGLTPSERLAELIATTT